MMNHQQVIALFQQLQQQHPQAFKFNFLFYSLIKTKGMLDEFKEIIPWILACMIFSGGTISTADRLSELLPQISHFQAIGGAVLMMMMIMRLYLPYVVWQIKHSSDSVYQYIKNAPLKLTVVIILQAVNLVFLQSSVLMYVLFFFAISFGFIRVYKESLFLDQSTNEQHYYLQQIRRATLWAYKQSRKTALKLKLGKKDDQTLQKQHQYFVELHNTLKHYENKICLIYKYKDLDSYLDEKS